MTEKKPSDQVPQNDQLAIYPQEYGWLSLRRKSGQEAKRRLNQPVYRIGREIGNDLVLPDPIISRYHARILCTPEGCLIEDLGSQNRTRLNDELLPPNEPKPLIEGDSIRIADYILIFHKPEPLGELDEEEFILTFAEAPPPEAPVVSISWPLPPRSSYQNVLPSFFSKDYLLDRFLLIFESIMAPINQLVDHMPLVLDPQTLPVDLLPWFASLLDLTLNENWPEERRRDLIRSASELYRWRGTRHGLSRYLEIYAGVTPEIDDDLAQAHTFRVTLRVPTGQQMDKSLVREIIENEKPAHTFYELLIEEYKPEVKPAPPARHTTVEKTDLIKSLDKELPTKDEPAPKKGLTKKIPEEEKQPEPEAIKLPEKKNRTTRTTTLDEQSSDEMKESKGKDLDQPKESLSDKVTSTENEPGETEQQSSPQSEKPNNDEDKNPE